MSHNIDMQELEKFSSQSLHWWDTEGALKTLHRINPTRLSYIQGKVNLAGKSVIDIGCGGGILSESLAKAGAHVTGIDADHSLIEVAKAHQAKSALTIDYLTTTAEEMAALHPAQFDIVTCLELLEHVPQPASIVEASAKLLKPGGHLFFSTLNRHPKAYLFAILGAEYLFKLLPKETHDYAKFIRPSELSNWVKKSGLNPQETRGLTYYPWGSCRLTEDLSINYLFYATQPLEKNHVSKTRCTI